MTDAENNRWLIVAGSVALLIGGVMCSLLAWICLSINDLTVSVAELRKDIAYLNAQIETQSKETQ